MIGKLPLRAAARPEVTIARGRHRLLALRVVDYLTNHVAAHVPSFTLRHLWYRRALGVQLGTHAGIHLGVRLWSYGPSQLRRDGLEIGAYSRVNRDCCLDVRGSLRIGENVSISPEVVILTASHGVDDPAFGVRVAPVVIEDHVWIGTRALILPGVTLGRGCVVCAGAVVTRDIAPLSVVAGVPARQVGTRPEHAAHYALDNPFPLFE